MALSVIRGRRQSLFVCCFVPFDFVLGLSGLQPAVVCLQNQRVNGDEMSSAFCSPITNCSLRQALSRSRSLKGILEHCSRLLSYLSHSGTKKKLTKLSLAFSYHLIVSGCMDRKLKCTVSAVTLLKVVIKMFIIVVSIKQ